jgi:uncharacterized protein YqjF (DUF2071 family)
MTTEKNTTGKFNSVSTMTTRDANLRARAEKAVERLGARHEANQAQQVAKRFDKLTRNDGHAPELKPSWATNDKRAWQMRAAKYQVAREHLARISKVRDVAKAMSKTTPDRQQNKQSGRNDLGR